MEIKNFNVKVWKEDNIATPEGNYMCVVPGENGYQWADLFKDRFRELEPGIDGDHIKALSFSLEFLCEDIEFIKINHFILDFFETIFSEGNVLSIRGLNNDNLFKYEILCFPLVRRVLKASNWVAKDEEGYKIHQDILNTFLASFENTFSINITNRADYADSGASAEPVAKVDLISQMDVPEPKASDYKEMIYDAAGFDAQTITDAGYERFTQMCSHIISYYTTGVEKALYFKAQVCDITPENFMKNVEDTTRRLYQNITDRDIKLLLDKVYSAVYKNYVLDQLIESDEISDIKVIDPKHIRVKVNGKRMTSNVGFINANDYINYINSLAIRYGLDLANEAYHVFTDEYTSPKFILRMNIATQYVNSSPFPYLHIRKIRKNKYTIDDLIEKGVMTRKVANYLIEKINTTGVVICGKGASGKTNLLNVLLDLIYYNMSGLVIQESKELFSNKHPDFMFQHITNSKNGRPAYGLKEEATNGLLTDLDHFIIGEIKGGEAWYFLNAASTGHICSCTVHAPSAKDAIDKLADYVTYESKYSKEQAMYMLKELKTIVFMSHFKIREIVEITGWDDEKKQLIFKTVYQL